ncbi:hypothetical protein CAPTEDRAFT_78774, partial [Capitella teleta]
LDFDTMQSHTLLVEASDHGTPPKSSLCLVLIHLTDVNDNEPIFSPSDLFVNVPEDSDAMHFVTRLRASDADSGNNAQLNYKIPLRGNSEHFRIDPATGDIYGLTDQLDREAIDLYEMYIVAQDSGVPPLRTETKLTVMVTDHNDNIP